MEDHIENNNHHINNYVVREHSHDEDISVSNDNDTLLMVIAQHKTEVAVNLALEENRRAEFIR